MKYLLTLTIVFCMGFSKNLNHPYASPQDPVLKQVAEEIPLDAILSPDIQELIDYMLEISEIERKEGRMVGLAAPQIGVSKQVILVDTLISPERVSFEHPMEVFINPQIVWQSEEMESFREGCFSTGSLAGVVPRAQKVRLIAYTRQGDKIEQEYEGYTARIIQHEVDHINGLRFPDRMTDFNNLHWVEPEEIEEYRANFENWPKKCSKEEWLKFIDEA